MFTCMRVGLDVFEPRLRTVLSDKCEPVSDCGNLDLLGCAEIPPLSQSDGTVQLEIYPVI